MQGTSSPDGKLFAYEGRWDDPMTGERNLKIKSSARWVGEDKIVFEMRKALPDGTEVKVMEITYTRKKG